MTQWTPDQRAQMCACLVKEELSTSIIARVAAAAVNFQHDELNHRLPAQAVEGSCLPRRHLFRDAQNASIGKLCHGRQRLERPPRVPPQRAKRHPTLAFLAGKCSEGHPSSNSATKAVCADGRLAGINRAWKLAGYATNGRGSEKRSTIRFGESKTIEFIVDESDGPTDKSDDQDSDSDSEPDLAGTIDPEEARKQYKREEVIRQAVRHILLNRPAGFPLDELYALLESVNVKNFSPEKCGYSSLERFARNQPRDVLVYDTISNVVRPPRWMR